MGLSAIILLGLMRMQNTAALFLERVQSIIKNNHEVAILFGQMQRDLSTAFVLVPGEPEPTAPDDKDDTKATGKDDAAKAESNKKADEDKKKQEREKREKNVFVAVPDEHVISTLKVDKKKVEAFKSVSFISTNALQVYEEKKIRLVRIVYELVPDKERSRKHETLYKLMRKETSDIDNVRAKEDQYATPTKDNQVQSLVIARDVKGMWLSYGMLKEAKKEIDKNKKQEEPTLVWKNSWASKDDKDTQGIVPQQIEVYIDMLDYTGVAVRYQAMIPVFAFGKKKEEIKKPTLQTTAPAAATPQPGAQPNATPAGLSPAPVGVGT